MHIKINNITVSKDNIKKTSTLSLKILVIQSLKNKVVLHNIISTLKKVNLELKNLLVLRKRYL